METASYHAFLAISSRVAFFSFPRLKYEDTQSVNKQYEGNTKALRESVLGVSSLKDDRDGTRTESPSSRRFSVGNINRTAYLNTSMFTFKMFRLINDVYFFRTARREACRLCFLSERRDSTRFVIMATRFVIYHFNSPLFKFLTS